MGEPRAPIATTTNGPVEGRRDDGVDVFRGVPFASAGRFAPPRPPAPWDGVRPALDFGPISPQGAGAHFQRVDLPQAEDCLSLNVWTPAVDGGARPVLVWIHGGAFRQGSGASPLYDGARLAARGDVVVVTINYRLAALGFAWHPDLGSGDGGPCGNWGLLDQVAALGWVRDNAAAFGGDPANVTIFGESAGAASVLLLCTMPAARGLFHKAAAQSGAILGLAPAKAAEVTEQLAAAAGVEDVAALRDLPLDELLAAQATVDAGSTAAMASFVPTRDGRVVPEHPLDALASGSAAGLPLVVGTNVDEWKLWAPMDPHSRDLDEDGLRRRLARRFHVDAIDPLLDAVRAVRVDRGEPADPNDLFYAIESERFFRVPALQAADAQAGHGPTFVYLFGWPSPAMGGWLGACHGLEIAFVFGNQGRGELAAFTGAGADADALGARMMDAWLAFARTGDPSTGSLPWPRHDPATRPTMVFDRATG
ncbi:MAG TPA: carboxylesterase family protein, partial [Acidimicrobiales bacterium]|nr:carboxylesterase family protein [Acidimicrobiales bacterium]